MAVLVMGAMPSIILKLRKLLKEEYNLQAGVKKHVRYLTLELERWTRCHGTTKGGPGRTTKGGPGAMELREVDQAALGKVDQVPWNQLDEHVKLWAHEVRGSSYDKEDSLDTFLGISKAVKPRRNRACSNASLGR